MKKYSKSKLSKWQKCLYSRVFTITGLIVITLLLSVLIKNFSKSRSILSEINGLDTQIEYLQGKNSEMTSLIDYYQSDDYVEIEAKRNLGLSREGEKSVIIPNEQVDKLRTNKLLQKSSAQDKHQEELTGEVVAMTESNYRLWWDYFFKNTI